ncbi:MAG: peroxiredoxin-like family protein [Bacteroidales bacterium]
MKYLLIALLIITASTIMAQEYNKAEELKGIQPGSNAPLFEAVDMNGEIFSLPDALKASPVVLIFYRGHWCPVCNKHLAKLQDSLQLITNKGVTLIAVSPEKPALLKKTSKKTGAEFRLLYDKDYEIATAYGVKFKPKKMQLATYNVALGADLKDAHSDESQQLPIPATYIIDQKGKIVWRHFNPDYKKRADVKDILKNLP